MNDKTENLQEIFLVYIDTDMNLKKEVFHTIIEGNEKNVNIKEEMDIDALYESLDEANKNTLEEIKNNFWFGVLSVTEKSAYQKLSRKIQEMIGKYNSIVIGLIDADLKISLMK